MMKYIAQVHVNLKPLFFLNFIGMILPKKIVNFLNAVINRMHSIQVSF